MGEKEKQGKPTWWRQGVHKMCPKHVCDTCVLGGSVYFSVVHILPLLYVLAAATLVPTSFSGLWPGFPAVNLLAFECYRCVALRYERVALRYERTHTRVAVRVFADDGVASC